VYQLLLILLAVSLTRQAVEFGVRQVVDRGRNRVRAHREALVTEQLSGPLAAWLADWPTSGGSSLERLQLVLRRVPLTIRELAGLTCGWDRRLAGPDSQTGETPVPPNHSES
jgi:hypothetical protein